MSQADKLLQSLLEPIPGEHRAGADIRGAAVYFDLQERHKEELDRELGLSAEPGGAPDWLGVAEEAEDILRDVSKDLGVAFWLLDAWLRLEAFHGLRRGLALVEDLQALFPTELHPQTPRSDPTDFSRRVGLMRGLIHSRFLLAVRSVPLTGKTAEGGPLSWADRERLRKEPGQSGAFQRAAAATPPEVMTRIVDDVEGCLQAVVQMEASAKERYPDAELSFRALRQLLDECFQEIASFRVVVADEEEEDEGEGDDAQGGGDDSGGATSGQGSTKGAGGGGQAGGSGGRSQVIVVEQAEGPGGVVVAAQTLWREGRSEDALNLLQGAVNQAVHGRERFLRILELAEFCIERSLSVVSRPLLDDLEKIELERNLREWEHPQVFARLVEALMAVRMPALPEAVSGQAKEIFEALCRSDIARAYKHYKALHEGA